MSVRKGSRTRFVAILVLCASAGVASAFIAIFGQIFSGSVRGAPFLDGSWVSMGLYNPALEQGSLDLEGIEIVKEIVNPRGYVFWSSRAVPASFGSSELRTSVHFISGDYFRHLGVSATRGDGSHGPAVLTDLTRSALISERFAQRLGITIADLPINLRVGDSWVDVTGILGGGFDGLEASGAGEIFVDAHLVGQIVFPGMPQHRIAQIPTYRMMLNAGSRADPAKIAQILNGAGRISRSYFYADGKGFAYDAHQGLFSTPAQAKAIRGAAWMSGLLAILLFVISVIGYCGARLIGEPHLLKNSLIRVALGEHRKHRLARLAREASGDALLVFLLCVPIAVYAVNVLIGLPLFSAVADLVKIEISVLLMACLFFASIPAAFLLLAKYFAARIFAKRGAYRGLGFSGAVQPLTKGLATLVVGLSIPCCVAAFSYYAGVQVLRGQSLGFGLERWAFATVDREQARPLTNTEQGLSESALAIALAERMGFKLSFSSCVPLSTTQPLTFADAPEGGGLVVIICHVNPTFFDVVEATFVAGQTFPLRDSSTVVVTSDFLSAYGAPAGLGSAVLEEALGRAYAIGGVVNPLNMQGPLRDTVPVVFLNGSELGAHGHLVLSGRPGATTDRLMQELSRELPGGIVVGPLNPGRSLLGPAIAVQTSQRDLISIGAALAVLLAVVSFASVFNLYISANAMQYSLRAALGATSTRLFTQMLYDGLKMIARGGVIAFPFAILAILVVRQYTPLSDHAAVGAMAAAAAGMIVLTLASALPTAFRFSRQPPAQKLLQA